MSRWVLAALALAACGGNANCKEACERLERCAYSSAGFSCDPDCSSPDTACASCINDEDRSCAAVASECNFQCPGKVFRVLK